MNRSKKPKGGSREKAGSEVWADWEIGDNTKGGEGRWQGNGNHTTHQEKPEEGERGGLKPRGVGGLTPGERKKRYFHKPTTKGSRKRNKTGTNQTVNKPRKSQTQADRGAGKKKKNGKSKARTPLWELPGVWWPVGM